MPFVPNTKDNVLAIIDAAIAECKVKKLNTEAGNLANLKAHIEKRKVLVKAPKNGFTLRNIEVGECFYAGAAMCLLTNLNVKISDDRTGQQAAQEQFLQAIYGILLATGLNFSMVESIAGVITERTDSIQASELSQEILCPHYLNNAEHTLLAIRRGFLGSLDQNLVQSLRANLNGILTAPTYASTPNPPPSNTNTKRAIIWVRSKGSDEAVRNLNLMRLLQIQSALGNYGVNEVILFGDNLKDDAGANEISGIKEMVAQATTDKRVLKVYNLMQVWNLNWFQPMKAANSFAYQMKICDLLVREFQCIGIVCMKSGGPDGSSLIGVPQIFFEETPNKYTGMCTRLGQTALCAPPWIQVPCVLGRGGFSRDTMNALVESFPRWEEVAIWLRDIVRTNPDVVAENVDGDDDDDAS